jgi:hypothetical protein
MSKKFQVIKATTKEIPGLTVGGRVKKFAANGTFEVDDPGEAKEIDKVLGMKGTGEVVVTPYDDKEPGHTYTFSGVDMSRIKTTRDNGYVWVRVDGKEIRVKREVAIAKGWHIPSRNAKRRRKGAEVQHA